MNHRIILITVILYLFVGNNFAQEKLTTKQDSKGNTANTFEYVLKQVGLQNSTINSNAEKIVFQKWKIRYEVIAGCVVTEKLLDVVKKK